MVRFRSVCLSDERDPDEISDVLGDNCLVDDVWVELDAGGR